MTSHSEFICRLYKEKTDSLKKSNSRPELSVTEASASVSSEEEVAGFTAGSQGNRRSDDVPAVTEPILTQPGLGITTTTITTITQTGGDWSTGLFDVCRDKTTCNVKTLDSHKHTQSHLYHSLYLSTKLVLCKSQQIIYSQFSLTSERLM